MIPDEQSLVFTKPKAKKKINSPQEKENKGAKEKAVKNKNKIKSMFKFSKRSKTLLNKVHPDLKALSIRAIEISSIDFAILSTTIRTKEKQAEYVRLGKSKTMRSRHLPNKMGKVCAIDVGAIIGGRVNWRADLYPDIADAYQQAARELDINLEWGGAWANLNQDKTVDELQYLYIKRKREQGKRPFLDLVHFQLPWSEYP